MQTHVLQQVLWDLGGLPGARLPLYDQDLVLSDGGQQVLPVGEDGQAAAPLLHGALLQLGLRQRRLRLVLDTPWSMLPWSPWQHALKG